MEEITNGFNIQSRIDAFRSVLRDEVNAILSSGAKTPINFQELQKRLNGYLRKMLDEDLSCPDLPPVAEFQAPDKPIETITVADACESTALQIQSEMMSGENYDDNFHNAIIELTRLGILQPSEITEENAPVIVKAFMVMKVKFNQILAARYKGDYVLEQQLCPQNMDNTTPIQHIEHIKESRQAILLSDLIKKYIETNIADGKWRKQTISDHQSRVSSLQVIIGDKNIDQYDRADMRKFRDTLMRLPANWRKLYNSSNTNLETLIANGKDSRKLSSKTVNVHVESVSSLFNWAINEGFLDTNPAKGLAIRDEQPDIDKRQSFTSEDIENIFFKGDYVQKAFSKPSYYWAPLIALYTGMRLEEICQLHCEDVYQEDGVYLIDIRRESSG